MDITHLAKWIGKTETLKERLAPLPSNALAATLNRDDAEYVEWTALPPPWHWRHFLQLVKLSDAGYDGHAALGSFLSPLPLPRRMWVGSRLNFHAVSTIFDTEAFSVHGEPEEDGRTFRLWARQHNGALAMQAKATIA